MTKECIAFASGSNSHVFAYAFVNRLPTTGGTAFFDVEFNQGIDADSNGSIDLYTDGLPVRVAGDLLLTYAFPGGNKQPALQASLWQTAGVPKTVCESSTTIPCWGKLSLNLLSVSAEATVSTDLLNWETAVDLTAAGLLPPGQCVTFRSAFVKGTSSGFGSEMKDLILPETLAADRCGDITINKVDDLAAPLAGAVFTLYNDLGVVGTYEAGTDTATTTTCTTNAAGTCKLGNNSLIFGNYCVVETTGVANHGTGDPQCTTIDVTHKHVTLTFINPRQLSAIKVTKTGKDKSAVGHERNLAGAKFKLDGADEKTTDANGNVCWEGLVKGSTHTVSETQAPTGYQIDDSSKDVTVTNAGTCAGTTNNVTFTDTPLSSITVTFDSKVNGATEATIECTGDAAEADLPEGPGKTLDNLVPGTYTCVVVVDP